MKVAIHQPQYFPWPPYLHKALSADVFVYFDTVQYSKNGVQNRNQIRAGGDALWLTVPVRNELGQRIAEAKIADPRAVAKHYKTLEGNYARAPGFPRWREELKALLATDRDSLSELAMASTEWMLGKLGATSRRVRATELPGGEGSASRLVASICKGLGATSYLTGTGALSYLDPADFSAIGCEVLVQEWQPLVYPQVGPGGGFVKDLSTLDLLLNCPDDAADRIRAAGRGWKQLAPSI
jgi:hypothetical protein